MTITGFIDGLYNREEAMKRLRYSKSNDQVSLHTEKAVSLLKLKDRRKTSGDKIMYNGQELTFFVMQKIEHIVSIIAEKENISFDSAREINFRKTISLLLTQRHQDTKLLFQIRPFSLLPSAIHKNQGSSSFISFITC